MPSLLYSRSNLIGKSLINAAHWMGFRLVRERLLTRIKKTHSPMFLLITGREIDCFMLYVLYFRTNLAPARRGLRNALPSLQYRNVFLGVYTTKIRDLLMPYSRSLYMCCGVKVIVVGKTQQQKFKFSTRLIARYINLIPFRKV